MASKATKSAAPLIHPRGSSDAKSRRQAKHSSALDWRVPIAVGSHVVHLVTFGMSVSFGVLYSELHSYFRIPNARAAWVASLYVGLTLGAGLPAGICVKTFGDRAVALIGSVFLAVGLFTSAFVPAFELLYLTFGLIGGVSASLSHVAANTILVKHFKEHRALAIALASCGVGIGNLALPALITYWLEEYGWRGTFIMLAAVAMQGIVAGATFRTPDDTDTKLILETETETTSTSPTEVESQQTFRTLVTLFHNRRYILFLLSGTLASMALYVPFTMLPDLLKTHTLAESQIAMVMSITGGGDILGRVMVGVLTSVWGVDKVSLHILVVTGAGVMAVVAPFLKAFPLYILYSIVYGISTGGFTGLQVATVSEIVGTEDTALGYGAMSTCKGLAGCIGIPIAGFIIDTSTNYGYAFIFAGTLFLLSAATAGTMKLAECRPRRIPHTDSFFIDVQHTKV